MLTSLVSPAHLSSPLHVQLSEQRECEGTELQQDKSVLLQKDERMLNKKTHMHFTYHQSHIAMHFLVKESFLLIMDIVRETPPTVTSCSVLDDRHRRVLEISDIRVPRRTRFIVPDKDFLSTLRV